MRRKRECGQTILLTVIALTVLLGFMGIGVDMGVMRYEKRLQQTAADAAALAGASNLCNSGPCTGYGGVTAGAQNAAIGDGFTDSSGNSLSVCGTGATPGTICVQVNNPPSDVALNGVTYPGGPHNGNSNYVEVLVTEVHPTYFLNVVGIKTETVTARAVATNLSGSTATNGCLYTIGPPSASIEGVNINGSAVLKAPTCGIDDDGNYNTKGNALTVSADMTAWSPTTSTLVTSP